MSTLWSYSLCGNYTRVGLKPFTLLYFILSVVLYITALPLLVYLSFKQKYKESIPARFFLFNNARFNSTNGVWFHVCSLGETRALKPVLELLEKEDIKITTITQHGKSRYKYSKNLKIKLCPYQMKTA